MIVLDTNVVSELMRAEPAPAVLTWFAAHDGRDLFLPVIAEAELRFGVARLQEGRRRTALSQALETMLAQDFAGRILPFDSDAARAHAAIAVRKERAGLVARDADTWIEAIATARGAALATRNLRDFTGCQVDLIDPWAGGA